MKIRPLQGSDRRWAADLVSWYFGAPRVVSRGVLHDTRMLPGLVAEQKGTPVGLLQYRIDRNQCEVVVLIAERRRQGIGRNLLNALSTMLGRLDGSACG